MKKNDGGLLDDRRRSDVAWSVTQMIMKRCDLRRLDAINAITTEWQFPACAQQRNDFRRSCVRV